MKEASRTATILDLAYASCGTCRISFRVLSEGHVSVWIIDVSGSIVRPLLGDLQPAGDHSLIWDGRDDSGHEQPAGFYQARIETTDGMTVGRVVLARTLLIQGIQKGRLPPVIRCPSQSAHEPPVLLDGSTLTRHPALTR